MKLAIHLRRTVDHESIQAWCPDLPGCSAVGSSEEEALRILRQRIDAQFAAARRGAPAGTRVVVVDV